MMGYKRFEKCWFFNNTKQANKQASKQASKQAFILYLLNYTF